MYANVMVPVLFGPWAEDLVARARISPGERVLDLACGTGAVASLAARAGSVSAVDRNPAMVEAARAMHKNIDWRAASAEDLPFSSATFDVALCQQGFQFFSDRAKAAGEAARVLRPGGRLLATVWRGPEANPWAAAAISALRSVNPSWAESMRKPFSMSGDELAQVFDSGFETVRTLSVRRDLKIDDPAAFAHGFVAALPFADELSAHAGATEMVAGRFSDSLKRLLSNGVVTSEVSLVVADRA
jgi:ubiquinone/menaquinone biosynthesis C-methylase UbiE